MNDQPAAFGRSWRWSELGWVVAWSAALAALTTIPYVIAAAAAPSGSRYLGFVFNPDEPNVHLSWIRQAADGAVLFHNQFTAEPHQGRFLNLFMLAAGRAAAALGWSAYEVWAVARVVAILLLGLAVYPLVVALSRNRSWRRLAMGVVFLSSGWGWLLAGVGEAAPLGGLFSPLPLLCGTLVLLGVMWGERALRDGDRLAAGGAALCGLLLTGVPRPDVHLLVIALVVYLAVLQLKEPSAWPRPAWYLAAIIIVAHPSLRLGEPLSAAGTVGWLVGVAAYGGILHAAELRPAARTRFLGLGLAWAAGWLAMGAVGGLDPVDVEPNLVMPEAVTFLSLYLNPLFTCSMALLAAALAAGERAVRTGDLTAGALGGVAGLLLANVHTYDAVPLLAVLVAYYVVLGLVEGSWRRDRTAALALLVALTVPAVGYQWWLIASEPLYRAKAYTVTASPAPATMLVSYGALVPLAVYGAMTLLRRRHPAGVFWTTWAVVHLLCLYLPTSLFPFQRKMAEGLHLVVGLLAAAGLLALARMAGTAMAWLATWPRLQEVGPVWPVRADVACRRTGWTSAVAVLGLLLLMPSNWLFVQSTLTAISQNNQAKVYAALMPPFYVAEAEWQAMDWISRELPREAVIACLPTIGSYLPGRADRTVYCGHWAETIDFGRKLRAFRDFLAEPATAAQRMQFLRSNGITHVYYGSYEQAVARGELPQIPELKRVYPYGEETGERPPAAVYEVLPAPPVTIDPASRESSPPAPTPQTASE